MSRINSEGYVEVMSYSFKNPHSKGTWRDWWIVKARPNGNYKSGTALPKIFIKDISLPRSLMGKKVRFKLEVFS